MGSLEIIEQTVRRVKRFIFSSFMRALSFALLETMYMNKTLNFADRCDYRSSLSRM